MQVLKHPRQACSRGYISNPKKKNDFLKAGTFYIQYIYYVSWSHLGTVNDEVRFIQHLFPSPSRNPLFGLLWGLRHISWQQGAVTDLNLTVKQSRSEMGSSCKT